MKKRTLFLILLAVAALAYAVVWHQVARISTYAFISGAPIRTPDEFALRYPVVSAAMWLIRIDVFVPVDNRADPDGCFREIFFHCRQNMLWGLVILGGCMLLLIPRPPGRAWRSILARTVWLLSLLAMIGTAAVAIFDLAIHERTFPKWDRKRGVDVLAEHHRFGHPTRDVIVPEGTNGIVLGKTDTKDVHVELDRRGWPTVSNVPVTMAQLGEVLRGQDPVRVLLWVDYRCRPADKAKLLTVISNAQPDSVYFVVSEGNVRDGNIRYRAIED